MTEAGSGGGGYGSLIATGAKAIGQASQKKPAPKKKAAAPGKKLGQPLKQAESASKHLKSGTRRRQGTK